MINLLKNSRVLVLAVLLVIFDLPAGAGRSSPSIPAASFEKGVLSKNGKINILRLEGSFREMGRQYGRLCAKDLRDFHAEIEALLIKERGFTREAVAGHAEQLYRFYPRRFKELLIGMAETSGLGLTDHKIINAFEHYLFNPAFSGHASQAACSALAAWGPFTKDGSLIFGRNYDFGADAERFKRFLTVTVLRPVGSGIPAAVVTYCGTLNATTVMNAEGLFLELNNGGLSAGHLSIRNRLSPPIGLLAMMVDSSTMQELDACMNTVNTQSAFIINVADRESAVSYEWAPHGVKRITANPRGLLVSTNHFVGDWGTPEPADDFFLTVTRRRNLIDLALKAKGTMDVKVMKKILDTDIEQGGATSHKARRIGKYNAPCTMFQVIALPHKKVLWIKIPGYMEWTRTGLSSLLAP